MTSATLYLIPATLGDTAINEVIPEHVTQIINTTDVFIVENVRTARRYLIKAGISKPIDQLTFYELNEHTKRNEIPRYIEPLLKGISVGLLSDAGCPAVADPGSDVVRMAHQYGIRVAPLVGPSSIILSLMASGMNGQSFAFIGYLPVKRPERVNKIRQIERRSQAEQQTQIFIEAPYRNVQMLQDLVQNCHPNTRICVAADLTLPSQYIATYTAAEWRGQEPDIDKRPAIFLLHAV